MRILFVSDGTAHGGARAFALASRGLAARGHEVETIDRCSALELRRKLQGADAVIVNSESDCTSAGSALALARTGGRVIRRVAPFEIAQFGAGARFIARFATTELLYSTEADRAAAAKAGARYGSHVAPLGIDIAEHDAVAPVAKSTIGVPTKGRLIVCVYDGQKRNVLTPLRTLSLLAPRHPDLHMAVIGAGRPDEFRMHGAALGINSMVTFLGARDDQLSVMRAADFGWIAASGDAAAFAALDFAGCRIPVLAERSQLTEHYIAENVGGLLLPVADPAIMAASVSAFLAQDEARVSMGNAARSRVEREFTFNAMIDGFEGAIGATRGQRSERTVA